MDTLRVLVVDDEAGMRHAVLRALRPFRVHLPDVEGEVCFDVEQASSGEEALALLSIRQPDLMLLDHKMGGMSGVEVLDELRRQERDILTIMITAFATLETAVRATKSGAFDFLAKPFTPDELKDTVRKATGHLMMQRQARKLAAEKRRIRFEFISVLGHELKAPLAAIEGYLHIVRDQALGSDLPAYKDVIERCLVRSEGMRKLILDLLDMTRIESGEKRRELTRVDVRAIARSAVETVKPAADQRHVTVVLAEDGPVEMTADRGEIEIIFNNLLSNAVKYNRDGGRVDVTLHADEQRVTIAVADTGIGMTPEEAAKLFNDFVRIKNDKTRDILGSGLGLSLVKKLALMYGGDVGVTSRPDVGSTFTVTLQREHKPPAVDDAAVRNTPLAARG
ncbi:MAG: ATP-binding protein [Planctomycetota bacterium]